MESSRSSPSPVRWKSCANQWADSAAISRSKQISWSLKDSTSHSSVETAKKKAGRVLAIGGRGSPDGLPHRTGPQAAYIVRTERGREEPGFELRRTRASGVVRRWWGPRGAGEELRRWHLGLRGP